jgi:hypothetical protein
LKYGLECIVWEQLFISPPGIFRHEIFLLCLAFGGRMAGERDKYAPSFSLRLTLSERAQLDREAGPLPLGDYIRRSLFAVPDVRKRVFRRPVQDAEALSQVLEALGRSRLPQNVNQLTKAAHSGSLPVTPETEQALQEACRALLEMRQSLMQALGHLPEGKAPPPDGHPKGNAP